MLVYLLPEQVAKFWPALKWTIEQAIPPITSMEEIDMNRVLESLLSGRMQMWAAIRDDEQKLVGFLTTTVAEEYVTGTKALVIFSIFALRNVGGELWKSGIATLKKFAKGQGCSRISGYTTEEVVKRLVTRLGGSCDFTYFEIGVD